MQDMPSAVGFHSSKSATQSLKTRLIQILETLHTLQFLGDWRERNVFTNEQRIFLTEVERKNQITLLKWNAAVVNLQIANCCWQYQDLERHPQISSNLKNLWWKPTGRRYKDQNSGLSEVTQGFCLVHNRCSPSCPCSFLAPWNSSPLPPTSLRYRADTDLSAVPTQYLGRPT